ncbi:hypothetical protein CR51_31220 [Caballeronia megalochromosomata]|nr:hypothetical protein CR51_31220 [Caballeronia megalochromosomata]
MSFASVEGRGSRFSLYTTVSALAPATRANQHGKRDRPDLHGTFMLLCDDEPIVLEGLRRLFLSAGALVLAAESMAAFDRILAEDNRIPGLIVTDMPLREGASGKDLMYLRIVIFSSPIFDAIVLEGSPRTSHVSVVGHPAESCDSTRQLRLEIGGQATLRRKKYSSTSGLVERVLDHFGD